MKKIKNKKINTISSIIEDLRKSLSKEDLKCVDQQFWEYQLKKKDIIEEVQDNVRYSFTIYEPIN